MDPRKILGVDDGATPEEIQRAYREKARKHHPDLGGDSWAFQQVQAAYQALSHPSSVTSPDSNQTPVNPSNQDPADDRPESSRSKKNNHSPNPQSRKRQTSTPDRNQPRSNGTATKKRPPKSGRAAMNWRDLFNGQLPLQTETTVFILLNCLDIFMTYALLTTTRGAVESNPIAAYFMARWGFDGAIVFKLVIVAVVTVIAQIVALRKIQTARWLLLAGSFLVGCVVIYSVLLYLKHLI